MNEAVEILTGNKAGFNEWKLTAKSIDMSCEEFGYQTFSDLNLNNIKFAGTEFIKCKFMHTSFRKSELYKVNFSRCTFPRCSFVKSKIGTCDFSKCVFKEGNFSEAIIINTNFSESDLSKLNSLILSNNFDGAKISLNDEIKIVRYENEPVVKKEQVEDN